MTDFQFWMLAAAIFMSGAAGARRESNAAGLTGLAVFSLIMAIIRWAPHG